MVPGSVGWKQMQFPHQRTGSVNRAPQGAFWCAAPSKTQGKARNEAFRSMLPLPGRPRLPAREALAILEPAGDPASQGKRA